MNARRQDVPGAEPAAPRAEPTAAREVSGQQKLPLLTLAAMVVGSMVGAGVFSLPSNFGAATGVFGALVAWAIAGSNEMTG